MNDERNELSWLLRLVIAFRNYMRIGFAAIAAGSAVFEVLPPFGIHSALLIFWASILSWMSRNPFCETDHVQRPADATPNPVE